MRISIFVHDLADNPIGRAVPIALALQKSYDVEILDCSHSELVSIHHSKICSMLKQSLSMAVIGLVPQLTLQNKQLAM
jgi:hypothetical protein